MQIQVDVKTERSVEFPTEGPLEGGEVDQEITCWT